MSTVVIDEITYTKASTLAKEFRYTTDYIGQLCRSGKVDAQLVGRSWYVSRDSLEKHASKRVEAFRQNEMSLEYNPFLQESVGPMKVSAPLSKKTKKMLHSNFALEDKAGFYSNTKYESDSVDLLPVLQIRPNLSIAPAGEKVSAKIKTIINSVSNDIKTVDVSPFIVPINQHKSVKIFTSEEASPVTVHTHAKTVLNQDQSKLTQTMSGIARPSVPATKSVSFTPSSVVLPVTSPHFPYRSLALAIFFLGVGAILSTLALDMEIHYDGIISSTSFSFNQTALANLFR